MNRKSYYDNKNETYRMNAMRKRLVLELISDQPKNILEFGCGRGELARALKERGHRISGADISTEALEVAKDVLEEIFAFDFEREWPEELTSKRFDLVIASELIEHLFNPEEFLIKARELLNPGGQLIITTPNFLFWKNRLKMLFGKFQYESKGLLDYGHIRFFTLKTARELTKKSGFIIERENHFYPNLYKRKATSLGRLFPGLLSFQLILLCRTK